MLYSHFIRGKRVNKLAFCIENECLPRSFDRDIEDIRLFLSESFSSREILYDRLDNMYYMNGEERVELEKDEFEIIEDILLGAKILQKEELRQLLFNLASNTNKPLGLTNSIKRHINRYAEPPDAKPLIKMHGDLSHVINNKLVIKLKLITTYGFEELELLPCDLTAVNGSLVFVGINPITLKTECFGLDKIDSFVIIRQMTQNDNRLVNNYLIKENGGNND